MALYKARRVLLMFAVIALSSSGCARSQMPQQTMNGEQYNVSSNQLEQSTETDKMTPFQELVATLVSDSLNILPSGISGEISDAIKDGMEIPDQDDEIDKNVFVSNTPEDIAFVAGLIVQQVYGSSASKAVTIPQTVLYSFEGKDIDSEISAAVSKLSSSQNHDRDAYNASLNLLVNSLLRIHAGKLKPTEGIYLRDANEDLYLHTEG